MIFRIQTAINVAQNVIITILYRLLRTIKESTQQKASIKKQTTGPPHTENAKQKKNQT